MTTAAQTVDFSGSADEAVKRMALVPMLIGLSAPVLVLLLVDAGALTRINLLFQMYVYALFSVASLLFVFSAIEKGDVTRVSVDKSAKRLLIERTGTLAKSVSELPFADIATVRIDARSDDDGYAIAVPVIVLTTKETVQLPAGTTEAEIAKLRGLLKGA